MSVTPNQPSLIFGDPSPSISFDGAAGLVDIGNAAALQLTTGTIEMWLSTTDARINQHALIGKYNAWLLLMYAGVLNFQDFTGGARSTLIFLADGKPHHIAASFVSGGASQTLVYVDGELKLTTTSTVVNQAFGVQIMAATSTWFTSGFAQHAAIYGSVLTNAQIRAHYLAGI